MSKFCILALISLSLMITGYAQNLDRADSAQAYAFGIHFYQERDFLQAYKFLTIYKYTHLSHLSEPGKREDSLKLAAALDYCYDVLEKAQKSGVNFLGKAYDGGPGDSTKQTLVVDPPVLPADL